MNKQQEKLIADYFSGNKEAGITLLASCRLDKALLKQLAEYTVIHRLVNFHFNDEGSDIFINELSYKLKQPNNSELVDKIKAQILTEQPFYKKRQFKIFLPLLFIIGLTSAYFISLLFFQTKPIAIVSNVASAVYADRKIDKNTIISKGVFELSSGFAEVQLSNGVTLIVEGPTKLDVVSTSSISVEHGSLVAINPDNKHFNLSTPSSQISESSSEFAVSVNKSGKSQIHVLKGQLTAKTNSENDYVYINKNQAREFDINTQVAVIESNPEKFMRALPGQSVTNPDYLHWSFDNENEVGFNCEGPGIQQKCYSAMKKVLLDGTSDKGTGNLTGPKITNGQFGQAIYFNGINTWLETNYQGIGGNNPRTVAFWVKVPKDFSIHNGYGILGWGLSKQHSAWQISPNPAAFDGPLGRIRVGTNKAEVIGTTDIRDNRWHHVAIVMFGGKDVNLATHILMYLDGKLERSSKKSIVKIFTKLQHPSATPLLIGRNIGFLNDKAPIENKFFKGWLDEIYIFDSALDQQQINNLMNYNQLNQH